MATIDLKDGYYSVKIDELDTKYQKFVLNSRLLKFCCFTKWSTSVAKKIY